MSEIKTVRLYGRLGTKFGRVFRLAVSSPAEAVRALCAMLPGFEAHLMTGHQRREEYAVFLGKQNLGADQLTISAGEQDIRIAPIIQGSKNGGLLTTIIGITLIIAGTVVPGMQWMIPIGIGLAIGGAIMMLSPMPTGLNDGERPENRPSYTFSGAVNTQAQGRPVPLLYGQGLVGSAIISAGIYAQDAA